MQFLAFPPFFPPIHMAPYTYVVVYVCVRVLSYLLFIYLHFNLNRHSVDEKVETSLRISTNAALVKPLYGDQCILFRI